MTMYKGLTIENVMHALNCTRSYVYKLIKNKELYVIDGLYPVRIDIGSIITKIRKLYPWIVDSCLTSLHYNLKQLELEYSYPQKKV